MFGIATDFSAACLLADCVFVCAQTRLSYCLWRKTTAIGNWTEEKIASFLFALFFIVLHKESDFEVYSTFEQLNCSFRSYRLSYTWMNYDRQHLISLLVQRFVRPRVNSWTVVTYVNGRHKKWKRIPGTEGEIPKLTLKTRFYLPPLGVAVTTSMHTYLYNTN